MAYQVLARKYRPQNFSDVIGQDHVTRTLKNALAQGRIAHGYIFSGHRGIGKTTIARILAMALNCRGVNGDATGPQAEPCGVCDSCTEIRAGGAVDVIEIDAATNRGIDEIRELRDGTRYRPARDRFKIYILDEAHQITDAAFNALLKTLEEPPAHIVMMMATTQPEDIPQTIRSRCQHFSFHAVRFDDIVAQLQSISAQEQIDADAEAIALVAEAGDGSMRDALSIMDQAIASGSFAEGRTAITAEQIRGLVGAISSDVLERFMEFVSKGSSLEVLTLIDRLLTEGQSPAHFARQFVRYLRNVLVAKVAGAESEVLQISADERARVVRTALLFSEEDLTRYMNIMLRTFDELGHKQEQRFHLELGLLKLVHAQRLLPLEQFLSAQSAAGAAAAPRPATGRSTQLGAAVPPQARQSQPGAAVPPANPFARPSAAPQPSPFEADRARKTPAPSSSKSEMSAPSSKQTSSAQTGSMQTGSLQTSSGQSSSGSAAAVALAEAPIEILTEPQIAAAAQEQPQDLLSQARNAIMEALDAAGQQSVAETLGEGTWTIADGELRIQLARPATLIGVLITANVKHIVAEALAQIAGIARPLKCSVVPGLSAVVRTETPAPSGSARSRAADDPLVRYFQEKFKAEIRTVIDQRKSRDKG